MSLTFESPAWLWLIAAAVPVAWLAWTWFTTMSAARRFSAWLTRTVLLVLLAAILAGASALRTTDRLALVAVVDLSGSVRDRAAPIPNPFEPTAPEQVAESPAPLIHPLEAARGVLRSLAAERGPDDLLGIVTFGDRPLAVAAPTRGTELVERPWPRHDDGTDIAAALELAASLIPADATGRLLVISDGAQTRGDALRAIEALARDRALAIDTVPLDLARLPDTSVERLDVPASAPSESVVTARVTLATTSPARGSLVLLYDDEPVDLDPGSPSDRLALDLEPGTRTVLVPVPLQPGRVHRFRAVWEPASLPAAADAGATADQIPDNNEAEGFTFTPGRGSVLILDGSGEPSPARALPTVLRDAGLDVEVRAPSAAPEDAVAWQGHDLVILDNVAAEELSDRAQLTLEAHVVRFGAGLVMVGGDKSFGAGGWKGSRIEPLLPVTLDVPERLVMQRVAVMVVLDSSGSMRGSVLGSSRSQQAIANESAARAIESLPSHDLVGVVRFSNAAELVVPLAPNADPAASAARVRAIAPNGGTNLWPALELAHEQLARADADIKHVIVLSDGRSQNAERLPDAARRMADEGIQVTAIAVGDEADRPTMSAIAREGGGRFFAVIDPNTLPRIFLAAVRVVRSPLIREGRFPPRPTTAGSPLVEGLGGLLPLRGFVLTEPRREPSIVTALTTAEGEPLLAHWPVGLGQAAAFTSDADAWAREWREAPLFAAFWTNAVRQLSRPPGRRWAQFDAQITDDRLRLRLDAASDEGRPIDRLRVPITLYPPVGPPIDAMMTQTGPGIYEAAFDAPHPGSYVVAATPSRGATQLPPVIAGAVAPRGAESRTTEPDHALLRDIAASTGGRVLALTDITADALFDRAAVVPHTAPLPIWQPLLTAAIAVFLLDVATRRIAWDRWFSRRFGADLRRAAAEAVADRSAQAASALGSLRARQPSRPSERPAQHDQAAEAPTLTRDDAAALARALHARRHQERIDEARARLRDRAAGAAPPGSPSPRSNPGGGPPSRSSPDPAPDADDAPSLLAAKRRARARFDNPDNPDRPDSSA